MPNTLPSHAHAPHHSAPPYATAPRTPLYRALYPYPYVYPLTTAPRPPAPTRAHHILTFVKVVIAYLFLIFVKVDMHASQPARTASVQPEGERWVAESPTYHMPYPFVKFFTKLAIWRQENKKFYEK